MIQKTPARGGGLKTLARDRRTLRVCACGWGCSGCLRVLCKSCCKIFARILPRKRGKRNRKNTPKRVKKHQQLVPIGSQMAPGTPSGEGRERGGKQHRKRVPAQPSNGYLFGPQKSHVLLLLASGRVSGVSPNRRLSLRSSASRLFRFSAVPGAPLRVPGGPRGSLLGRPGPRK